MNLSWKLIPVIFTIHAITVYFIMRWVVYDLSLDKYFEDNHFPPRSIDEVKKLSDLMKEFTITRYSTLLIFHFTGFYFLQTWWIPGTFMFNLLSGSLFGVLHSWIYCVLLNTVGGYSWFLVSKHFGKELIQRDYIQTKAEKLRELISQHKSNLFYYLTFLRIFPGSPNWLMNITFPHLGIKGHYVFFSIFLGLMPWNFIVWNAGNVLSTIQSKEDVVNPTRYNESSISVLI